MKIKVGMTCPDMPRTIKKKHKPNNPNKQTSKAHKFWPICEKVKQVKPLTLSLPGAKYHEKPRLSQPLQLHVGNARLP